MNAHRPSPMTRLRAGPKAVPHTTRDSSSLKLFTKGKNAPEMSVGSTIRPKLCIDRPSSHRLDSITKSRQALQVWQLRCLREGHPLGCLGGGEYVALAWCWKTALIVVLFLVALPVPRGADAQSAASISGVVKDTDGAVMPGVSVVIQNDASGRHRR